MKQHNILLQLVNPAYLRRINNQEISNQSELPKKNINMSCSENKVRDIENSVKLPSVTSISISQSNDVNQQDNWYSYIKNMLSFSVLQKTKHLPHDKPLYLQHDSIIKSFKIKRFLNYRIASNRQLQLFWGYNHGPSLNIFFLRVHFIYQSIYFICCVIFFCPVIFEEVNISAGVLYTIIALFPIAIQWLFIYSSLLLDMTTVANVGMLRKQKVVEEVTRNQKTAKVLKTFLVFTKLKMNKNTEKKKMDINMLDPLIKKEAEEITELFDYYDSNKSGKMDKVELNDFMTTMGLSLSTKEMEELFLLLDTNSDGTISKDEYLQWYFDTFRNLSSHRELIEVAKELFRNVDVDNSGEVSVVEFQDFLTRMNSGLSMEEIVSFFNDFDEDVSGSISIDEFLKVLESAVYHQ